MDNPLTSYAKTVPKVDNKWEIKDTGTELNRYEKFIDEFSTVKYNE